jgi:hypothetical protein
VSVRFPVEVFLGEEKVYSFMVPWGSVIDPTDNQLLSRAVDQVTIDKTWVDRYRPNKSFEWDRLVLWIADKSLEYSR